VLASFLYAGTPQDPLACGVVVGLVAGVIGAASLVPIRRVTRVMPADVLREE
jgi:ABC-type antimicrobial peptide transport system permease subunit